MVWLMGHSQGNKSALHTIALPPLEYVEAILEICLLKVLTLWSVYNMEHLLFMANFHMEGIKLSNYKIINDEHE